MNDTCYTGMLAQFAAGLTEVLTGDAGPIEPCVRTTVGVAGSVAPTGISAPAGRVRRASNSAIYAGTSRLPPGCSPTAAAATAATALALCRDAHRHRDKENNRHHDCASCCNDLISHFPSSRLISA